MAKYIVVLQVNGLCRSKNRCKWRAIINFYLIFSGSKLMYAEQKRNLCCDKEKAGMSKSETQQEADCMKSKRLNQNKNIDGQKASKSHVKECKVKVVPHSQQRGRKSKIHFSFIVFLSIHRDQSTNIITNLIIVDSLSKQTQTEKKKKRFRKDSYGKALALAHELD